MVKLVGILNITHNSFSDGGLYLDPEVAKARADQMFEDGAEWVDVGAESTKPGAEPISLDEEWRRLEPVLGYLIPKYPGRISVDSYHPATVRRVMEIGRVIINDVTAFRQPEMQDLALESGAKIIISHSPFIDIQRGHQTTPVTTVRQVKDDLLESAAAMIARGFDPKNAIFDPGIGFGKSTDDNHALSWKLLEFGDEVPQYEVMIGYSNKRLLGGTDIDANLRAARIAIAHGADYLRVHDVAGHKTGLGL